MNVFELSDIHCEDRPGMRSILDVVSVPEGTDVIVIAGDMGAWMAGKGKDNLIYTVVVEPFLATGLPVITIGGNHEYYLSDMHEVDQELLALSETIPNWYHLQNGTSVVFKDWAFIGATLWTGLAGTDKPIASKQALGPLNDRKCIKIAGKGMTYKDYIALHQKHLESLAIALDLAREAGLKTALITHHAPSYRFIPRSYMHEKASLCFASNAIAVLKPDVWFFGHIHRHYQEKIGSVLCVANPMGYVEEGILLSRSFLPLDILIKD